MNGCRCDKSGWCELQGRHVTPLLIRICQSSDNAREKMSAVAADRQGAVERCRGGWSLSLVGTFLRALIRFVRHGLPVVAWQNESERLTQCATCPYRIGGRCGLCCCWLWIKARWATESCPVGKWSAATAGIGNGVGCGCGGKKKPNTLPSHNSPPNPAHQRSDQ